MRWIGFVIGVLVLPAFVLVPSGAPAAGAEPCTVSGTSGPDVLTGTAGPDVICGFGGDDVLRGRGDDDVLRGGAGRDRLFPGGGDDVVNGGADDDTVRYRDLSGGVTVDLVMGTATGAVAGSDDLASVEGVVGSTGDDTLVGTQDEDFIRGFGGDDVIAPGGGGDLVNGGAGVDLLDYSGVGNGVAVDLARRFLFDGSPGRAAGVEDVVGSPFADRLRGNEAPNVITGGGGADEINVQDGFGGDVVSADPGSTCLGDPGDTISC